MLSIKTWIKQNDKSEVEHWIEILSAIDVDQGSVLIIETNDNDVPQRYFFDEIDKERSKKMSIQLTTSNQCKLIWLVEQWAIKNNYKEAAEDYFCHNDRPKKNFPTGQQSCRCLRQTAALRSSAQWAIQ